MPKILLSFSGIRLPWGYSSLKMGFQNAFQHFLPLPDSWRVSQPQDVSDGEIAQVRPMDCSQGWGVVHSRQVGTKGPVDIREA